MLANLAERYSRTRSATETLCKPLAVEDLVVQSMPDASPTRWHLAHTTWFWDTFVLARWEPDYRPINAGYQFSSIPTTTASASNSPVHDAGC